MIGQWSGLVIIEEMNVPTTPGDLPSGESSGRWPRGWALEERTIKSGRGISCGQTYKLSPAEGGNPQGVLIKLQLFGCKELFEVEVKSYRPGRLLFLTGEDWSSPFVDARQEKMGALGCDHREYVQRDKTLRVGDFDTHLVVAVHPQGKKERPWIEEVVGIILDS